MMKRYRYLVIPVLALLACMVLFVSCGDSDNGIGPGNDTLPSDTENGVEIHVNGELSADTIWAGPMTFDIHIKNSVNLGAMTLGFVISSPDGATWIWDDTKAVPVANSRMDPDGDGSTVWDMTGLLIRNDDVNNISPDSVMVGGVSLNGNLPAGELEHMISFQLSVGPADGSIHTICIDNGDFPSGAPFVFTDVNANVFAPTFPGQFCWPVKKR